MSEPKQNDFSFDRDFAEGLNFLDEGPKKAPGPSPQERMRTQRELLINEYQSLVTDLQGDGGAVVREVAKALALRINKLVQEDPEARCLVQILDSVGNKVDSGQVTVNRMTEKLEKFNAAP